MKNVFLKDILRDLRKSAGRFAGMFAIVAIGVFVFAGLGTAGGMMYIVADDYFRENHFYDLQVVSTFGLNDKDIAAMEAIPGVLEVQGAYGMDGLLQSGTTELNAKIHGVELGENRFRQLNPPTILQGKYPEQENEMLVEQAVLDLLGLTLGDEIELASGRSADIRTQLKTNRFRIVGVAESPLYFYFERGSSSVGSGEADVFVFIPNDCFLQNIYSEAFIEAEGTRELDTFSDEYDALIETVSDRVEAAGEIRIPLRKAEATRSAWVAVNEAGEELERQRSEVTEGLLAGDNELAGVERDVRQSRADIGLAEVELADGLAILDAQEAELRRGVAEITTGLDTLRSQEQALTLGNYELTSAREELTLSEEEYLGGKREAMNASSDMEEGLATIAENLGELDAAFTELRDGLRALETERQALLDQYNASSDPAEQDAILSELEGISAQLTLLRAQEAELETAREELETAAEDIHGARPELEDAFQELRRARSELNAGYTDYQAGRNQYAITLEAIQSAIRQMEAQKAELESGFPEIDTMRLELEAARQTLQQNRRDIAISQSTLEDGKSDLILQRERLMEEITAAEAVIRQSRAEIMDIDDPKWYVLDRYKNMGFNMFEGEAATVKDFGTAFPLLFFLIAALVSLTTMTRLVEEQRVIMGTYKALGYSERVIRMKYLFFAVTPSLLGALVGGLIGMVFFPRFIIDLMYSAMFNIPDYDVVLNGVSMTAGAGLAVLSTVIPTLVTCRGALIEVPAGLMRPKSPPAGKKTPLEYIAPLWRRLSFLYKITFRNIFRYKQRLFMTVCGVGGSTALLLGGLGLSDSLRPMVAMQYEDLFRYDLLVAFEDDVSSSSLLSTRKAIDGSSLTSRSLLLRQEMVEAHPGDGSTVDAVMTVANTDGLADFILLRDRVSGAAVPLENEGAIVTEPLQQEFDLMLGDELTLRDRDDEEFTVTVAGFCEGYLSSAVYMTPEYYALQSGKEYEDNTILVGQAGDVTAEEQDAFTQTILDRNGVASVVSMKTQGTQFSDILTSVQSIVVLLIVISALMAFTVLLNLTNINIVERMREIATIEVLGFRDKEVSSYVYRENMIVTFLSALFGVFLGGYLHVFLLETIEGGGVMFPRILTTTSYFVAIIGTILFAVTVALMTGGKLKKIDMLGALKSAE